MKNKKIYIFIIVLFIGLGASVFYYNNKKSTKAAATRTGLVGHWTMDAGDTNGLTIYDKSGKNNNGIMAAGVAASTGKIKQAKEFPGTNGDNISIPYAPLLKTGTFSVSAWVYGHDFSGNRVIIMNGGAFNANFIMYPDAFGFDGNLGWVATPSSPISANKWVFLTGTFDGTTIRFYIDGTQAQQQDTANVPDQDTTGIKIGTWQAGDGAFDGLLDDVRIYDRALSAAEVAQLYNSADINRVNTAVKASSTPSGMGQLVGYWNMDNSDRSRNLIYDRSGFNNNGTVVGATTSTGKIKEARSFNGTTDWIQVSDNDSLKPSIEITVSSWIKLNGLTTPTTCGGSSVNTQWHIHKRNAATGNYSAYSLISDGNGTTYWWALVLSVPGVSTVGADSQASGIQPKVGKWTHVVGIFNRPNMKLYVDGVLAGTGTFDNDIYHYTRPLFIGRSGECGGPDEGIWDSYTNGSIDDVRIYNYAMSAQDVMNLYNSAKVNYVGGADRTGLVGYWTMDSTDRSRNLIYDKSGFNNNGTLTGTTTSTGRIKEARTFNGTSDYITIANESNFDFERTQPFTLATWVRPGTLGTAQILFVKQLGGTAGWLLDIDSANTFNTYFINTWSANAIQVNSVSTAKINTWQHVVVTYSGTSVASGVKIYIDGKADNTTTVYDSLSASMLNNQEVWLGRRNHTDNLYFSGRMDDARIYNRALSAQEVVNLYNSARMNYK